MFKLSSLRDPDICSFAVLCSFVADVSFLQNCNLQNRRETMTFIQCVLPQLM